MLSRGRELNGMCAEVTIVVMSTFVERADLRPLAVEQANLRLPGRVRSGVTWRLRRLMSGSIERADLRSLAVRKEVVGTSDASCFQVVAFVLASSSSCRWQVVVVVVSK